MPCINICKIICISINNLNQNFLCLECIFYFIFFKQACCNVVNSKVKLMMLTYHLEQCLHLECVYNSLQCCLRRQLTRFWTGA